MIGDIIRKMRISSGLSQKALGEKVGLAPNTISHYEVSTNKPKFEIIERVAKACDFEIIFRDKNSGEEITVKENGKKS